MGKVKAKALEPGSKIEEVDTRNARRNKSGKRAKELLEKKQVEQVGEKCVGGS